MQIFTFDKNGESYRTTILEINSLLLIKLFDQEDLVGEVKGVRESSAKLLIGDIFIEDSLIPSAANFWAAIVRTISGFHPKPVNYRNRGLGSALLKLLIEHAHSTGVKHLYGRVVQQDIQTTPNLLGWYQKHNFEIELLPEVDIDGTIAWIHLNI